MQVLKKFIKDNNLTFSDGNRNTPLTIFCGFALSRKATKEECIKSINNIDIKTERELSRIYDYAKTHNYKHFWETEQAKKEYIF